MGCLHSVEEEIRPIPSAVSLKYGGIAKRGPGSGHHGEEVENSEEHNDSIATVGRTRSNRVKEVSFSGSNTSSRSRLRQQLTTQNVLHHFLAKKMLQSIPPQTWERQLFDDVLSRCTREDEFLDLLRDAQKLPGLAEFFLPMEDAPKALRDRAALVSIFRRVLEAQYVHPDPSFSVVSSPSMKKSDVYACDGPLSDSTATSSANNNNTTTNITNSPPPSSGDNPSGDFFMEVHPHVVPSTEES